MHGFLLFVHVCACLILIGLVLFQPDRGDGMAGAFGGMGGSVTFGVKTQNTVWWGTIVVAGIFLLSALGLTYLDRPQFAQKPAVEPAAPAPR